LDRDRPPVRREARTLLSDSPRRRARAGSGSASRCPSARELSASRCADRGARGATSGSTERTRGSRQVSREIRGSGRSGKSPRDCSRFRAPPGASAGAPGSRRWTRPTTGSKTRGCLSPDKSGHEPGPNRRGPGDAVRCHSCSGRMDQSQNQSDELIGRCPKCGQPRAILYVMVPLGFVYAACESRCENEATGVPPAA